MSPFRTVLLTGATGYFGTHLLARLLETGTDVVTCLVRAPTATAGLGRLRRSLEAFKLWQTAWDSRINVLCGDLGAPQMGLGSAYSELAGKFDAIYHNGAHVNYILNYSQLKPTNVGGTHDVIRVAQSAGVPLFFVSTLRLFDHRADKRPIKETDTIDVETIAAASGYAHSKAMAERLIAVSAKQKLKAAIFRPGLLWGDGESGVPNVNDAISRLMRGCLSLGQAPLSALQVNLTSVRYATEGLVALSYQEACIGRTWHLVNDEPTPVNMLVQALRDYGFHLETAGYSHWVNGLRTARSSADNDLNPLLGYFTPGFPEESTKRIFDSSVTQLALAPIAAAHPQFDAAYLRNNIRGMIDFGFLAEPSFARPRLVES